VSRIRVIPSSEYSGLGSVVETGHYSLYTDQRDVPAPLRVYGDYPQEGDFYGLIVAASNSSQNPPRLGGITPKPGQPVYMVNTVRYDETQRSEPHVNVDRVLLFTDTQDQAFRLPLADHEAHFKRLSTDTGLDTILGMYSIPNQPSGLVSDLSSAGAWRDFSTGSGP
jgi:hypothetical protein